MTQYFVNLDEAPQITPPFGAWAAFDRTKILFSCPSVQEITPIGTPTSTKRFDDLCDNRAQEIVKVAAGRKIYVFWSGGIDSTLVLAALRKHTDHKQITVVYSGESIEEYPWMFDNWVRGKLDTIKFHNLPTDTKLLDEHSKDGVICTGEIADQLFGSMTYAKYKHPEMLLKDWRFAWHFTNPNFVEKLERFVAACPQKINNIKEFLWWYNYAVKYQGVCFRTIINSPGVVLEQSMFHFFHTKYFNDWAVSTPIEAKFYGSDLRQYKMVAKEYIFKETGDIDYKNNKIKLPSAGFGHVLSRTPYRKISTNWTWHE